MKIRVWHLLVLLIAGGAFAATGADVTWVKENVKKVTENVVSLVRLFNKGGAEIRPKTTEPVEVTVSTGSMVANEMISEDVDRPGNTVPESGAAPVPESPRPAAGLESGNPAGTNQKVAPKKKTAAKKAKTNRKKRPRKRQAAQPAKASKPATSASTPAATQKANSNDPAAGLVGTYVSMELVSGREVKGVLQEKTDTHYVVELPGMGPFKYPVQNVRGIKAAE